MKNKPRQAADAKRESTKFPRPLTIKIFKKIDALESCLRVHAAMSGWCDIPVWKDVLDQYRASVACGVTSPIFVRRYGETCVAAVEALEEAFQDRHGYDDKAWMTSGHLTNSESMLQAAKSEAAAGARRVEKERQDSHRESLVRQAWARAMGPTKRNPDAIKNSDVLQQFAHVWADDQKRFPERERRAEPTRNTLKPLIDAVRDEIKNTRQSSG